ncbi:hypothetical protein [Humisphaera borealis]|uniref:Uncharacterized protein n=1 Tax=Humisphaera borealis TaxID=2807512 RepID=A0A7M2WUJ8_9BACT|nr:hypothetical protein [Humisphaera borealis]QOV89197.1 hypothetical protein IPV69_23775 [Humisphaera borealis]
MTFSVPRKVLSDIAVLSDELTDRMHELLERNTDGLLSEIERKELNTLVNVAQFGQIIALALQPPSNP